MKYFSEMIRTNKFVLSNPFAHKAQVRFQHSLTEAKPSSFGRVGIAMVNTIEETFEANDETSGIRIKAENYRFSEIEVQAGEEEEYMAPSMNVINPFK